MTSRSEVSTLWRAKTSRSAWPKSPPTTATTRTSVKKLAEIEKCDADPPSIRSRLPNGVSTASKATEPTTSKDILVISNLELRIVNFKLDELAVCAFCFLLSAFCLRFTLFRFRPAESLQILFSLLTKRTVGITVDQLRQVIARVFTQLVRGNFAGLLALIFRQPE